MFDEFGDPTMIAEVFAEDAEWREPGSGPISGCYRGPQAISGLFASVLSRSDETFDVLKIEDVLADDNHGVAFVLVEGHRAGRHIRTTDAIVFDFRDGKIVLGRVLSEDQAEVDAFWD